MAYVASGVLGTNENGSLVTTQHNIGPREFEVGETQVRIQPGVLTVNWFGVALAGAVIVGGYAFWKYFFSESGKQRFNEWMRQWAAEEA
jgi:hypothetical protein